MKGLTSLLYAKGDLLECYGLLPKSLLAISYA